MRQYPGEESIDDERQKGVANVYQKLLPSLWLKVRIEERYDTEDQLRTKEATWKDMLGAGQYSEIASFNWTCSCSQRRTYPWL